MTIEQIERGRRVQIVDDRGIKRSAGHILGESRGALLGYVDVALDPEFVTKDRYGNRYEISSVPVEYVDVLS